MGQAKQKHLQKQLEQLGGRIVSEGSPDGAPQNAPPLSNTGGSERNGEPGSGNQSATDRNRINLSVSLGAYAALAGAAETLGTTVAQVTLMAVNAGLPHLAEQVRAVRELSQ